VSENKVLRKIFGLKREEVTGGLRQLHNEELRNLYSSPNINRVIKSRTMRWAGYVERMEAMRIHTEFWSEYLKKWDRLGDLVVGGRITLN
jgi:hypothetical protein